MIRLNSRYLLFALIFFCIEVFIALFVHDDFIRPYIGDVLVVILLYCLLKSFFNIPVFTAAMMVLGFSFLIEFLQYLHIVDKLGLQDVTIARIVIGNSFSWLDLICYLIGILLILLVEFVLVDQTLKVRPRS